MNWGGWGGGVNFGWMSQEKDEHPGRAAGEGTVVECPHCGGAVEVPAAVDGAIVCPHCGGELSVQAAADGAGFVVDDEQASSEADPQEDEIDLQQVRYAARLRRSAYRRGSHMLVLALVCLGGMAQLGYWIVREVVQGRALSSREAMYGVLILLLGRLGWRFWRRFKEMRRESLRSELEEPQTPPRFEELSDGSQVARNLEDLGREK